MQADSLLFESPGKPSKGRILAINVYMYVYFTAVTNYLHLSGRLDIIELGTECDLFFAYLKCQVYGTFMEVRWLRLLLMQKMRV